MYIFLLEQMTVFPLLSKITILYDFIIVQVSKSVEQNEIGVRVCHNLQMVNDLLGLGFSLEWFSSNEDTCGQDRSDDEFSL